MPERRPHWRGAAGRADALHPQEHFLEDVPPESTFKLSKIGGRLEKEADVINQFLYSPEGPFFGEEQNGPEGGGDLCDERGSSSSPP